MYIKDKKWKLNYFDVLIGVIFFFIVTSEEFIFFYNFLSIKRSIILGFTILMLTIGGYNLIRKPKINKFHFFFKIVVFLLCIYFIIHEFIFNDGLRSIRYSLYLLIALFTWEKIRIIKVAKVFVLSISTFSFFLVFQFFLLTIFYQGNVSSFPNKPGLEETYGRTEPIVNPFGLGYMSKDPWDSPFSFKNFQFKRANSFTTEPKYASVIFLTSLGLLFLLKNIFNNRFKTLLFLHLAGLFLIFAGSMFMSLLLSLILFFIVRKKLTFFKLSYFFSIILFVFPIFLFFLLNYLPEYWTGRAINGIQTLASLNEIFSINASLMGDGYLADTLKNITFLPFVILNRYGFIGLTGMILLFICLLKSASEMQLRIPIQKTKFYLLGIIILLINYFMYFIVFLPNIVSPLSVFIIIIILNISPEILMKETEKINIDR